MNNLVYNIHLLTGKISQPGNGPFSLTGQPSACGTAREVGTFTHKLPHGVVMNKKDREIGGKEFGKFLLKKYHLNQPITQQKCLEL